MNRRLYGALVGALTLLMGAGAALGATGTASAQTATRHDPAGPKVTLTARSDSLTDSSPFSLVSVARACPAGYQDNLGVYLVVPDGRESALALNLTDGAPYSADTVTTRPPAQPATGVLVRSLASAFQIVHVPVADGVYPIHVVCGNADHADFPDRPTATGFVQVSGSTFTVADLPAPVETTLRLSADPATHVQAGNTFTLTARVSAAASGTVRFTTDNTNPIGSPVPVVNGTAQVTAPANANPGVRRYVATFVPSDPIGYAQDVAVFSYAFTAAPGIQVTDAAGNALGDTPRLTPGQHVEVSAQGFLPASEEEVTASVSGALGFFPAVTTDAAGAVTGYDLHVPYVIADGTHTLTLRGRTSHVSVTFTFTTKWPS
ncbi:Ig-like domain (group 3) [Actinacidiphila yanglinensis]|uniref:Ig-like domain (Group 3) n=1 Tax=Actinacidiphila yanglinensis TaxID=310779 RepID=A0A1H5W5K5_9ACTN|nr:Ig-like domain repeat protein [Actinacidiphila yanglinensis]SEF94772.1 Ig-like domain (group 3) [Actinacidiphila yanglinensis]